MTEALRVTYINCDFCTAKNHCTACGGELAQALLQKPGIHAAGINLPDHALHISHSLTSDALEDLLDGMGLLVG